MIIKTMQYSILILITINIHSKEKMVVSMFASLIKWYKGQMKDTSSLREKGTPGVLLICHP